MSALQSPAARLHRTANWGIWLASAAMAVLAVFIGYMLWTALRDADGLARMLTGELDLPGPAPLLGRLQALGVTVLWLVTDVIGFALMWQVRRLFAGIRARGVFTDKTAQRLRRTGWLVFAIGPASVVVNAAATMLMSLWRDTGALRGSVSISDADIYAMVVGLVIVAVGHIMVDAARLEAENRAFV